MRRTLVRLMPVITLIAAACIIGVVMQRKGGGRAMERIGFQDADFPLGMPAGGGVDHRFLLLSAWRVAEIPVALEFSAPLGGEQGGLAYNAQKFWDMNEARGGRHLGDDWNGIGGMDTDLGDPVFAVADGLVIYSGAPSPGWGKLVVIAHKLPDGRTLHSMYAHLHRIDVPLGAVVARGGRLGTVGTANGNYPAHLHLELREGGGGVDIGGGYGALPLNRLDPMALLAAAMDPSAAEALAPSPLARALAAGGAPWTSLEIRNAEKFPGLPGE